MTQERLTVQQAARLHSIRPETVRVWIRDGLLPAEKLGQVWYIKLEDLTKYVDTK